MTANSRPFCERVGGSERSYLLLVEGDPGFLCCKKERDVFVFVPGTDQPRQSRRDGRYEMENHKHTHTQIHTLHNNMAPHANVHTTPLFYCSSPLSGAHSTVYINEHNKYLRLKSTVQTWTHTISLRGGFGRHFIVFYTDRQRKQVIEGDQVWNNEMSSVFPKQPPAAFQRKKQTEITLNIK